MQRRDAIGPSLLFFQVASLMAEILESNKGMAYGHQSPQGEEAAAICEDCERVVDKAWEKVGAIAEEDERAAELIASHFLMGEPWADVAVANRMSVGMCKKLASDAMRRYDERR